VAQHLDVYIRINHDNTHPPLIRHLIKMIILDSDATINELIVELTRLTPLQRRQNVFTFLEQGLGRRPVVDIIEVMPHGVKTDDVVDLTLFEPAAIAPPDRIVSVLAPSPTLSPPPPPVASTSAAALMPPPPLRKTLATLCSDASSAARTRPHGNKVLKKGKKKAPESGKVRSPSLSPKKKRRGINYTGESACTADDYSDDNYFPGQSQNESCF